jgi:SNARE associated Golgi protein
MAAPCSSWAPLRGWRPLTTRSVDGPAQPARHLGLGGRHPADPGRPRAPRSTGLGDHCPRRDLSHRLGTLIALVGLTLAGVAGLPADSTPVRQVIERALKGRSPEAIAALSDRAGPWGIALTRSLPYSIPEAIVCLAGLARMPVRTFLVSLGLGSISTALLYAGIGAGWARDPLLALAISYLLPIASLSAALYLTRRRGAGVVERNRRCLVRMRRLQ